MADVQPPARFRFSLTRLLSSVTFVAAGLGGLVAVQRGPWPIEWVGVVLGLYFASAALIGAGLFIPFHRGGLGAIVGFVAIWLYLIAEALWK